MSGSPSSHTVVSILTEDQYPVSAQQDSPLSPAMLLLALEDANRTIKEQVLEISLKNRRIQELEQLVVSLTSTSLSDGIASERRKMDKLTLPEESSVIFSRSAPTTFHRDVLELEGLHQPIQCEDDSPVPTMTKRLLPYSPTLASSRSTGAVALSDLQKSSPEIATDSAIVSDSLDTPVGLNQRLAMNTAQRRKLQPRVGSKSTGALKSPSAASPGLSTPFRDDMETKRFVWKQDSQQPQLCILHDNPQICKTLASMLEALGTSGAFESSSSKSSKVEGAKEPVLCMLETHNGQGVASLVVGELVFSGASRALNEAEATDYEERGSCVMILSQLRGCACEIKTLPQRNRGDIVEVDFPFSPPPLSYDQVLALFRPCTARVDVILDPIRQGTWYPYYEGSRKMAPQFRSRGVGYLRLGDDMSNFGTAFLSLTAGRSYLDNGKASVVKDSPAPKAMHTPSPSPSVSQGPSTGSGSQSAGSGTRLSRTQSFRSLIRTARSSSSNEEQAGEEEEEVVGMAAAGVIVEEAQVVGLLSQLRGAQKWSDRVEALQRLLPLLSPQLTPQTQEDVLRCAHEQCKHTNPTVACAALQVLKGLVPAAEKTSPRLGASITSSPRWTAVVLDVLSLLRSNHKLVAEMASACLLHWLHLTYSTALLISHLSDLLPPNKSSHRLLTFLQSVLCVERSRCHLPDGLDEHALFQLTKALRGQLTHREEATRDAAMTVLATTLSIEIRQCQARSRATSMGESGEAHDQSKQRVPPQNWTEALSFLRQGTQAVVKDLLSTSTKAADKIWQALVSSFKVDDVQPLYLPSQPTTRASTASTSERDSDVDGRNRAQSGSVTEAPRQDAGAEEQAARAGVRSLKRRLSSHCRLKAPSPTEPVATASQPSQALQTVWFETRLLLQRVPQSASQWEEVDHVIRLSQSFFPQFQAVASEGQLSIGVLLQRVLPFNEDTSSANQAQSAPTSSSPRAVAARYVQLAKDAAAIRSLIRVKMADEADFVQAHQAVHTLRGHVHTLRQAAEDHGQTLTDLVQSLEKTL